jgi:hypothetical protein
MDKTHSRIDSIKRRIIQIDEDIEIIKGIFYDTENHYSNSDLGYANLIKQLRRREAKKRKLLNDLREERKHL